ncbi:IPP transferase-domain-containing protein [Ampelomyces quisqualis]|uniref:tRNA dimethylallyltransferase n=1 Tax=Ampelomyces quisqualis TaxID=50730 RepID=A0A6A5QUU4_AMPQU|nr:IPP transferase-domain-containing protein [Ampelomyces quisqualis]
MAHVPFQPLVAVVGATGTGKSDLAVDLARRFDGEIINGDAMQLYEGLPIITNKITPEEMKNVPHHLLGCIGLREETWTVGRFVKRALSAIEEIRVRGKLPILVGGTHYYTQSLLFHDALSSEPGLNTEQNGDQFPILEEPTETILAKLKEVDPTMAERWHPNERRKIQRSLEIFLKTGKPASQVYSEQRLRTERLPAASDKLATGSMTSMRFATLILWVHAEKEILNQRLDRRVDKMLERGLLDELEMLARFKQEHDAKSGTTVDQSRGIWMSIGYKEFLDYRKALTEPEPSATDLQQLKTKGIEKTQSATRQYANRQLKWIRIKLLNALIRAGQQSNVFLVDGTDLTKWEENVVQPALRVTEQFLAGQKLPSPSSFSSTAAEMLQPKRSYDLGQRPDLWQRRVCATCGTVAVTENDWALHVKSRGHRRAVGIEKKKKNNQEAAKPSLKELQRDLIDVLEDHVHTFLEYEAMRSD